MPSGVSRAIHRIATSALGAVVAAVLAADLEAGWARRSAAEPPGFGGTFFALMGLMAPVALGIGVGAGVVSFFMHPEAPPSLAMLRVRGAASERRALVAALVPLAALGSLVFVLLSSRLALAALASDASPRDSGALLAVVCSALAVGIAQATVGFARVLARRWSKAPPEPRFTAVIGVLIAAGIFAAAVATGTTSGAGGSFAMFGVLKRPELDLRAPGLLVMIAVGAYLLPAALERVPSVVAVVVATLSLSLTIYSADIGLSQRRVALAVERGAPLSKMMLVRLRKLTDRDHDGFSARFGGGDCDDTNPAINPGADDIPGNAIDEDCSGGDAMPIASAHHETAPSEASKSALGQVPPDLNLVLITIDTLRHDLGYMGYQRPISPNIDRLAAASVVFEKAYSLASYTSKSLAPLLIGKYGSETHRGFSHFNRFGPDDRFLQERLHEHGIRTLSAQGYFYFFQPGYGFERGFDVIDSSAAPKVVQMEGDRTVTADKVTDAAIAALAKPENTSGRFYLWVHYVDPHTEYVKHDDFDFGSGSRERYDGEVAFVDAHVGRLLDAISKAGFAKKTLIAVTSDHGEAFGEHGMIRHGFELWEELVRVPLLIQVPGLPPRRIPERRSSIDLVPTLLELMHQPKPSGQGTDFVSGDSLVTEMTAPSGYAYPKKPVFIDMAAGPNNAERQALIENDQKLVTSGGRALSLFDLSKDPDEKHDLLDDETVARPMLEQFKAFRRGLRVVEVRPER